MQTNNDAAIYNKEYICKMSAQCVVMES